MPQAETVRSCRQLAEAFPRIHYKDNSSKLQFTGLEPGKDVYNITAPFADGGTLDNQMSRTTRYVSEDTPGRRLTCE